MPIENDLTTTNDLPVTPPIPDHINTVPKEKQVTKIVSWAFCNLDQWEMRSLLFKVCEQRRSMQLGMGAKESEEQSLV